MSDYKMVWLNSDSVDISREVNGRRKYHTYTPTEASQERLIDIARMCDARPNYQRGKLFSVFPYSGKCNNGN